MHEPEKSDLFVVAQKPRNGCGGGGAKEEGRGECAQTAHASDAEPRQRVPGVRACTASSKARKKERFTAVLHHVDVDLLKAAYYWRKRNAAPGVDFTGRHLVQPRSKAAGHRHQPQCGLFIRRLPMANEGGRGVS